MHIHTHATSPRIMSRLTCCRRKVSKPPSASLNVCGLPCLSSCERPRYQAPSASERKTLWKKVSRGSALLALTIAGSSSMPM